MSTGRFVLAKLHEKNTPLRPFLSLPGNSYEHSNEMLAKILDTISGANIETNKQEAREIIEMVQLHSDENIIFYCKKFVH